MTGLLLAASALLGALQQPVADFRFPSEPLAPRTIALGGAGVAQGYDAEAALNPATIVGSYRVSLHRFEGYAGYNGFVVAVATPLGRHVRLGLSGRHLDYGKVIEDDLGPGAAGLDVKEEAYAATLAVKLHRRVAVGLRISHEAGTYLSSTVGGTSASVGAVVSPSAGLAIGLGVRELGGPARGNLSGAEYALPTTLRIGAAQRFRLAAQDFTLLVDVERRVRGRTDRGAHIGGEWQIAPALALRAGYATVANPDVEGERLDRWSGGVGVNLGKVALGAGAQFGGAYSGTELFLGLDAFR